jgi:hypothetical protein
MPHSLAVAEAIGDQLRVEGRWPPEDQNKVMGADYHYDVNSMPLFLKAVKDRLEALSPPCSFQFDSAFAKANLASSVAVLTGNIAAIATP